ncbi:TrbC/VirB2 family protein [bacterium]|nr:TrbC/VirB2 family protein [bacterium]
MNNIFTRSALYLTIVSFSPLLASAQQATAPLPSPTPGIPTLYAFVQAILSIIVKVGIPIIVIFIVFAGFHLLTAQGNEEKLKVGKRSIVWAVIGAAVILGAWALSVAIQGTVNIITV